MLVGEIVAVWVMVGVFVCDTAGELVHVGVMVCVLRIITGVSVEFGDEGVPLEHPGTITARKAEVNAKNRNKNDFFIITSQKCI